MSSEDFEAAAAIDAQLQVSVGSRPDRSWLVACWLRSHAAPGLIGPATLVLLNPIINNRSWQHGSSS